MNRRGILTIAFAALLLALLVGAGIWLVISRQPLQSFVLPDGSTMTLYKVTYGTNHEVPYGGGWRDYLYPFLPRNLRTNLGAKVISFVPSETFASNGNSLVIWLKRSGAIPAPVPPNTNSSSPRLRVTVVDENGLEAGATIRNFSGGALSAYLLQNYPRRSRRIHLRFADPRVTAAQTAPSILAEFDIPNPAPSKAAAWVAETLPATRETNGLEISLLNFDTGYTSADIIRFMNSNNGNVASINPASAFKTYSRAEFDFREGGQRATGWVIQSLRASAATGDTLLMRGFSVGTNSEGSIYSFAGAFWPEEPAWELTAEAWRTADFRPEELWTVKDIPIPAQGESSVDFAQTNINGVQVSVNLSWQRTINSTSYVVSSGVVIATNITTRVRRPADQATLTVTITNSPPDVHVLVVQVTTDQNQNVPQTSTSSGTLFQFIGTNVATRKPVRSFQSTYVLKVPENEATVNAVIAVTRSRIATFRVKPTLAK